MAARRAAPASVPLLAWPQARDAARIEAERQALNAEIRRHPPQSHRRIYLEGRIRELTDQALRTTLDPAADNEPARS